MPSPSNSIAMPNFRFKLQQANRTGYRQPTPTPDARRTRAAGARPKQVKRRPVLAIPLLMAMSSSAGNNGTIQIEPVPKRRRLLDAGGPIEDDETARQKMRDAKVYEGGVDGVIGEYVGFDPDNVGDVKIINSKDIKPMGYFAMKGDLPMMRWLYVNGADTQDLDVADYFPMLMAVTNGGKAKNNSARMEVCKWLFAHGAAKDIKRRSHNGASPLCIFFPFSNQRDLNRWLILNGALCKDDDSGELDVEIMKQDLGGVVPWRVQERKALLEWATDLHRARTSSLLFLSGALSRPKHAYRTRRNVSHVQLLGGKPGIRELIGDYVGFVRGREARIIRRLTEMLPNLFGSIQQLDGKQGAIEEL